MALCSQADIEALRQIDITAEPDSTITALIRMAEGVLEGVTGRSFDVVADAEIDPATLDQTDGLIWLETYPVTAVAITNNDDEPYTLNTHFTWESNGKIRRLGAAGGAWTWYWQYEPFSTPRWPVGTTITYSGGASDPDEIPNDLRTLCAQVAADLFDMGAGAGPAGVVQEALGGWSATYQRLAGNLTDQQKKIARRYARHRGQLVLT